MTLVTLTEDIILDHVWPLATTRFGPVQVAVCRFARRPCAALRRYRRLVIRHQFGPYSGLGSSSEDIPASFPYPRMLGI